MFSIPNSFAAMNGQFKGTIDGNFIDIPVSCEFGGGRVFVKSDSKFREDTNKDGITLDLVFIIGEQKLIAYTTVKGKEYNTMGKPEVSGTRFSYKEVLKSKERGDYKTDFVVTCKK